MLLRIWRTNFDALRLDELNRFARERSTPMFESFTGCIGHVFSHHDDAYMTLTVWIGHHAIRAAEESHVYRETVDALVATGMLGDDQTVEVFDIDGLHIGERETDEAEQNGK